MKLIDLFFFQWTLILVNYPPTKQIYLSTICPPIQSSTAPPHINNYFLKNFHTYSRLLYYEWFSASFFFSTEPFFHYSFTVVVQPQVFRFQFKTECDKSDKSDRECPRATDSRLSSELKGFFSTKVKINYS